MANTKKTSAQTTKQSTTKKPATKSTKKVIQPIAKENIEIVNKNKEVKEEIKIEIAVDNKTTSVQKVKVSQQLTKEEKKFNKNVKRRKVGLIMNIFGSSSTLFGWLILLVLSIGIVLFVKDKYLEILNDLTQTKIQDTLEQLIRDANSQQGLSAEEIYNKIILSIQDNGLNFGKKHLSLEQVKDVFGTVFDKTTLTQVIQNSLDNGGSVQLPETVNAEFINTVIDKLDLDIVKNMDSLLVIVAAALTAINLLNIIFASRLIVVKGKISKPLFIITSILSINIINWIGMLVFVVNDKKTVF
ncbi:hypothetical protein [Mesoplasma florum]|uniref:hypothetical protein n=1 Tax=Mesoplasma florum TaxID=2151 RepID=UPI000BE3126A|nr:hypothetical protein [Mesoplasma florum]ATI73403.1 hypothetical protein CQZ69_02420 [Mesoplasma florum]AVN61803.1 hypothetical protein CG004_02430 [Mesoplasma florum]